MVVLAQTAKFETIQMGDRLPTIQKSETQQNIDNYRKLNGRPDGRQNVGGIHHDPEYAEQAIFAGTVNYGVTTVGFMSELLQYAFPLRAVQLGSISMRAIEPIRPDDVVTYSGKVTGKHEEAGQRLVEVELRGENQLGQAVAIAKATVVL